MTKILLVEDDKSLREIYGVRLLAEGYDIISAGDGEDALALAIKDRPALIVSDVMMPKISGFDMLDILRSTTETRDIKVIMMTALSSEDQRKRGESLGADRYLVKSQVGIEDVVRTVHEVLGDTPATPEAPAQVSSAPAGVNVPPRVDAVPAQPAAAASPPVPNLGQPIMSPIAPPVQNSNPLPQPTAPFSTQRPAGLGDRIIQPLEHAGDPLATPISDQMAQELQQHQVSAPTQSVAPDPMPAPQAPNPAPEPVLQPPTLNSTALAPQVPTAPLASPTAAGDEPMAPPAPAIDISTLSVPPTAQQDAIEFQQEQSSAANEDEASLAARLNFELTQPGDELPPPQPPTPMPTPEQAEQPNEQQPPAAAA